MKGRGGGGGGGGVGGGGGGEAGSGTHAGTLPPSPGSTAIRFVKAGPFRRTKRTALTDDDVIEHPMSSRPAPRGAGLRDQFVRLAGLGDAGRMIVRQDHGGGISGQRQLHDLARLWTLAPSIVRGNTSSKQITR